MGLNELIEIEKGKRLRRSFFELERQMYVIGIDPGTLTGFALYDKEAKTLTAVMTVKVHEAFELVRRMKADGFKIHVRVEDARKRKWYGPGSNAKQQGAGAIKIQCKQWEEFLKSEGISFDLVSPAQIKTKVDARKFKMITGWTARTSNHGRDAAMMVYGL